MVLIAKLFLTLSALLPLLDKLVHRLGFGIALHHVFSCKTNPSTICSQDGLVGRIRYSLKTQKKAM